MDRRIKYGLGVVEAFVVLCVGILMGGSLLPLFQQVQSYEKQRYEMVYQYDNDVAMNGSYYLVDSVLTNKTSKKFKAEMLMQKPVDYTEISDLGLNVILEKHEIAITENIMDRLCLNIGDSIEFYNPVYDLYVNYTIVEVLDLTYGFYEATVNSDIGAVIIGYDSTISEMTKLDSVVFTTRDFKPGETGMSLSWSFNKTEIQKDILIAAVIKAIVVYLTMSLVMFVMWFAYFIFGCTRLVNMIKSGSTVKNQNKYVAENYLWPNILAVIGSGLVWCLVLSINGTHMQGVATALTIMLLIPVFVGKYAYIKVLGRRV